MSCSAGAPERNGAHRTGHGFGECHQDIGLQITPTFVHFLLKPATPVRAAIGPTSPEKLLEKVAEAGAAELEVFGALSSCPGTPGLCAKALSPRAGRRGEPALPVRAERIVFFALFLVAENFVGLVDLLEFVFPLRLVFGDVRMMNSGEFAKCLANFVFTGRTFHTQRFVIVLIFDSHNPDLSIQFHAPSISR